MEGKYIIEGLRLCKDSFCDDCPYRQYPFICRDNLVEDAYNLIEALRSTNKQLIKSEKEKRKELWNKAINQFAEQLHEKLYGFPTVYNSAFGRIIDNLAKEMTNSIENDL